MKYRRLFTFITFLFIVGSIFICSTYLIAYFSPPISLNSANSLYIYDNNDNVVFMGSNNHEWVTLGEIDSKFIDYIINVEDQYFYYHKGFDVLRIIKSLISNIKEGKIVAGASSISQQYVKNLYLSFEQTWDRKIDEAFLTVRLETHYSKDEILEGYLNTIYFGNGIYGIKDASEYYFNKDIKSISVEEAIILAGIPKSPNNYNPVNNWDACIKRSKIVAQVLLENNVLSEEEYNNLDFDSLYIHGEHKSNNLSTLMYYQDAVLEELHNIGTIPEDLIESGGLRIFTNLDMDTQIKMEESIKKNVLDDETQIASIVVEPGTGKVLALAGGKDYAISQYNRVTQAKRQVGSTIKPFLYYAALNNGMTTATQFKSESTTFVFAEDKKYTPTNYADTYANKNISMNAALAYSDNIYAVKTHLFLGENVLVDILKLCGLDENINANPSLALGATEINMLDYAEAYATLASGGEHNELYFINRIEDIDGNVLYIRKDDGRQVLDKSLTYILNESLTNTYNYNYVDYNSPTVIYLNGRMSRKYALKSGTTDNDYWISGYNNDVLMLVWAGNDNNEDAPKKYSKIIKDIWLDTVEYYEENKEDTWYKLPDNVVALPMDEISGEYDINSKSLYYFIKGTEIPYTQ